MAVTHIICIIIHPLNPLIIQDAAEANVLQQNMEFLRKETFPKNCRLCHHKVCHSHILYKLLICLLHHKTIFWAKREHRDY